MSTLDVDAILAPPAVDAAVAALAARNAHHAGAMSAEERSAAQTHWRELAIEILAAARAALREVPASVSPVAGLGADLGRAVIVMEDGEREDEIAVHVSFHPQLEELADGEVAGTPAQIAALELLGAFEDESEED